MIPLATYVTILQAGHIAHTLAQAMPPTEAKRLINLDPSLATSCYFPVEIEAARLRLAWLDEEYTTLEYDTKE